MKVFTKILGALLLTAILAVCVTVAVKHKKDDGGRNISAIVISEIMTKNSSSCPDENNDYYDWIELCNTSGADVDISGCGLSDDITGAVKYVFPAGTLIKANDYLVIWCSGDADLGQYYAPFKLSVQDDVVLYDHGGNPTESIELRSVADGMSLARKNAESSEFIEMSPTPGFPNNDEGIAAYAEAMEAIVKANTATSSDIIINEFMAQNATTLKSADGGYYDWVELYNRTDDDINIKGYYLSDDIDNPKKFQIAQDEIIPAEGFIIIFCSGLDEAPDGEIHTPFKLSAYEESVVLADGDGKILDKEVYSRQKADISFARNEDGEFELTDKPTPGYPNTQSGYEKFMSTVNLPASDLYISEMMGSNGSVSIQLSDGSNIYPDFIELYNSGGEDINLEGYALTDNPANPAKWTFPDKTLKSGETLVVLAIENDYGTDGGYYRTGFSISSDGDTVYLFAPDGSFMDKLRADKFYKDMSVGRTAKGKTVIYESPSPNEKNSDKGFNGITSTPEFSMEPGVYDEEEIKVTLKCADGEKIYYTTDCTTPTTDSKEYNGNPIIINKNTVIRAKTYRNGYFNNFSCASGTYLLKSDGADHDLPVVTLVTDPHNLWSDENGIYAYGETVDLETDTWPYWSTEANFWKDIEVPAYFAVFGDDDNKQVFGQNIGINIAGAFGQGRDQKGFGITARDEYGNNRMEYKFFDDLDFTEYKSLLLRCGAQDQANGKFRDELSAVLLRNTDVNVLYQECKPYVLYLNGKYWGVYFMREKRCRFFVAQHEGEGLQDAENVTLIKSETRANYGTTTEWKALMDYVREHGVTDDSHYKYLTDRLDIDSFTDYMICEIYAANTDYWNIQMCKMNDGKWKFVYYDFCWSWGANGGGVNHNTLAARRDHKQPCSDLFNELLKRSDYREKFIRRCAELMDSVYSKDRVLESIEMLYSQVGPEIERERALFNSPDSPYISYLGRMEPQNYSSYQSFERHVEKMRSFAESRRDIVIEQLKNEFGDTEGDVLKEVFG